MDHCLAVRQGASGFHPGAFLFLIPREWPDISKKPRQLFRNPHPRDSVIDRLLYFSRMREFKN